MPTDPFDGLPSGHFQCIAADPPWAFKSYTAYEASNDNGTRRDAEKHYPVMGLSDIADMPVARLAAKDAHLFLWTTGPFIEKSFDVMSAWGFNYSGMAFVWIKTNRVRGTIERTISSLEIEKELFVGLGHTTRHNAEYVLLGRRGSPKRNARDVREVIVSPLREHSRKPDEFFTRVERYCDGPRLELFSRQPRVGWHTWGNQSDKFADAA